jgi:hypothetical protein
MCGKQCPGTANGAPKCSAGKCGVQCNPGYTECDGKCVDLDTSREHCGSCPTACDAGEVCKDAQCTTDCGALATCDGSCVDVSSDTSNCGRCGEVCTAPANAAPRCNSGTCSYQCSGSFIPCGAGCVDAKNDVNNCGQCGKVCGGPPSGGRATCVNSMCGIQCDAGLTLCQGKCVLLGVLGCLL